MAAPFVAMETDLRKEERVAFTADLCGYNVFEALGRYFSLWAWCSDRGLEDAPEDSDGYTVPDAVVRRFLGPRGVDGILGDGCEALAMGERRSDGMIYLRGTHKTVGRLRLARASSTAGGRVRADTARREAGRFAPDIVGETTNDQPWNHSPDPAASSEIPDPRSQIPDQRSEKLAPRAPAIPPTPTVSVEHGSGQPVHHDDVTQKGAATPGQSASSAAGNVAEPQIGPTLDRADHPLPAGTFRPDEPADRGRLATETYRRVSDARIEIAAELELPPPLPLPPITPSSRGAAFRGLLDRVREEGALAPAACDRVIANLIAQARDERSIDWLGERAFTEGGWRFAREWIPGAARTSLVNRKRAGPIRAVRDVRVGALQPLQPSEYPEGEIEFP